MERIAQEFLQNRFYWTAYRWASGRISAFRNRSRQTSVYVSGNQTVRNWSVYKSLIENLYILPNEQHNGYGTKLLLFAMQQCAETPTLWILENNLKAYALYFKHGFRKTGRKGKLSESLFESEMKFINWVLCVVEEYDKPNEKTLFAIFFPIKRHSIAECLFTWRLLRWNCGGTSDGSPSGVWCAGTGRSAAKSFVGCPL